MTNATATQINGRTVDEWATLAAQYTESARRSRQASLDSFQRCDTDGYLSQWAGDSMAREYDSKAAWALDFGYTTTRVLLNLDGSIASTHEKEGQYGYYWVLNDAAAVRFGNRFVSLSKARAYSKQTAANRRKGFVLALARVPAHAPKLRGSNMLSLSAYAEPQWDRVRAGEIEIIDPDLLATRQAREDGSEVV